MANSFPLKGEQDKELGALDAPLKVSAQQVPNLTVRIRAGSFWSTDGQVVEFAGGNTPTITPPASLSRWSLVSLSSTGSIQVTHGATSATPSIPVPPAGSLPLAAIYMSSTTVAITEQMIQDVRPFAQAIESVPNLQTEISNRPTFTDMNNAIAAAISSGTVISVNSQTGVVNLTAGDVGAAPAVHGHVIADISGLQTALNAKADLASTNTFTNTLTVQTTGNQPISLVSSDPGSSGLLVDRPGALPDARLEWDESTDSWLIGVTGNMDTVLTDAVIATKMDLVTGAVTGNVATYGVGGQVVDSGTALTSLASTSALTAGLATKVSLSGDTMTGFLTLNADPTAALHAATKQYVDNADATKVNTTQTIALSGDVTATATAYGSGNITLTTSLSNVGTPVSNQFVKITTDASGRVSATSPVVAGDITPLVDGTYVNITGDTMTGFLTLNADPTAALHAATKQYVDNADATKVNKAGDTMTGNLNMNNNKVVGLAAATANGEAVRYDEFNAHTSNVNMHVDHSTVTIFAGTGLTGGGDITTSRTLALTNTGVLSGTYGTSTAVAMFTVDAQGRLSAASNQPISFPVTSVNGQVGAVALDTADLLTPVTTQATSYTVVTGDEVVLADATAGALVVTLPAALSGRRVTVKKIDASVNTVTVSPGAATIDGAASYVISTQWNAVTVLSDGTNWFIVSKVV